MIRDIGFGPRLSPFLLLVFALVAASFGGDAGSGGPSAPPAAPAAANPGVRVSSLEAAYDVNCGRNQPGTLFIGAEVEPHLAVNPARPSNLIAVWQQDRWSNGAARGLVHAVSSDGGLTWARRSLPFSRCAGGTFERASDPWIAIGPTGIAHEMALAVTGSAFGAGSLSAMLVSRSTDFGVSWSLPQALIQDTAPFFNDKNSITADPFDARFVYAAWDRLVQDAGGPAYFARTTDGGERWEQARAIHDPGPTAQIIGAEVVVTDAGDLLYFFTQIDAIGSENRSSVAVTRSRDRGVTWEPAVTVSPSFAVGTTDPDTGGQVRDGATLMHAAAGPGVVVVTFQDSRFSNGARDGVAFSQSRDGGRTWSEPAQINAAPAFAAFTPQPQVSSDGVISVGYFDLRANTPDPSTLPTQYWLARSVDGRTWTESRLAGPFNLASAPNAGGAFVGDYVGLVAAGSSVLSLLAQSGNDINNRTDIFFTATSAARISAESAARGYRALSGPGGVPTPEMRRRVSDEIARTLGDKMTIRPRRSDEGPARR